MKEISKDKSINDLPKYSFENGVLTLEGKIFPEDAKIFWMPIIAELKIYIENKKRLTANFKLDYLNTASMLWISTTFQMLQQLSIIADVTINWYFRKNDEDMEIFGEDYKSSTRIKKFNMINYE